jgi:hypothetical protein
MTDTTQESGTYNLTLPVRIATYQGSGIVLVGSRCSGKTTLREELQYFDSMYYDVLSIAPRRDIRDGEDLAAVQTSRAVTLDQLVEHPSPFALAYRERQQLYGYPLDHFQEQGIPIVRIIGEEGLRMILDNGTLPNMLRVQLTLDASQEDDLERRIISRLIRKKKLPKDFDISSASEEQRALIQGDKEYIASIVGMFRTYDSQFDTTFCNSALLDLDPRRYLYTDENPDGIVVTDIAMRLNKLYQLWQAESARTGTRASVVDVTDAFIAEIVTYLFDTSLSALKTGDHLHVGTTEEYASKRGVRGDVLKERTNAISVESIVRDGPVLRVYVIPHETAPPHQRDVENKSSLDFEVLGALAYAVESRESVRPRFLTTGGYIHGLEWSLSDTASVIHSPLLEASKYTRLEIRYHYADSSK